MIAVHSEGQLIGYCDEVVYIYLAENESYVSCDKDKAEGFCAKLLRDVTNEETGETRQTLVDEVYRLKEDGLRGTEPIGTMEDVNGALAMASVADEALAILEGRVS